MRDSTLQSIEPFVGVQFPSVLIAAVLGLLLIWVLFIALPRLRGPSSRGRKWSIVLVGPCNGGKTSLFLKLRDKYTGRGTVTSMQPNEGIVKLKSTQDGGKEKTVHMIDLPGHPRLESYFFKNITAARGIIFVVDSIDFMPNKEEVARQMFRLLTSPVVRGRGLPILVACNKSDGGAKAHTVDFIRKRMEKDINDILATRNSMETLDESESEQIVLGSSRVFKFSDLETKRKYHRPVHVSFASISVFDGDLSAVEDFCSKTCKL